MPTATTAVSRPPAVLGDLREPPDRRAARWRSVLDRQDFDPATQMIAADEAAAAPHAAARLRLATLLSTYGGEYHTDSYALDAIAARMASGAERVILWGDEDAIDRARSLLATGAEDPAAVPPLGTATTLDVADELGGGHAELCRTGSVTATVAAGPPLLTDLLALTTGGPWRTLAAVPRNRASAPGVRGGAAIHRLHVRTIGSTFGGLAPWHVMQGGALEVLDYRELHVAEAPTLDGPAVLASADDAAYVSALARLAGDPLEAVVGERPGPARRWTQRSAAEGALADANPRVARPDADGEHATLDAVLQDVEARPHACLVVRLPLRAGTDEQRELTARGYVLGALASGGADGPAGLWSRPRRGLPLALPHYLDRTGGTDAERTLLALLRERCARWERGA